MSNESVMGLSAQEQAALAEELDEPTVQDDLPEDDESEDPPAQAAAEPSEEQSEEQVEEAEPEVAEPEEFVPIPKVNPVENYDTVMSELDAKEDAISEQFDNGDMNQKEYRQALREIEAQRRQYEDQQREFKRAQELSNAKWQWECDTFMSNIKNVEGIDYLGSDLLGAALDTAVKRLANDPANADKNGKWFLEKAHSEVKSLFKMETPKPVARDPKTEALKARKPDMSRVPRTLSEIPAAQTEVANSDEFSHLENLSGMALERALAKLSPDAVDRYLTR